MILAKLKEATREQHENLENTVDVMNQMFSLENYKTLLTKFYRFYSAIEPQVAANDLKSAGFDFVARRKTPLLETDLKNLEIFEDVKSLRWNDLPALDSNAKAFGSLYVMEGATLGGQVIMRHLKQHLDITPENGGAFFNSYGAMVGPMWKEFCAITTEFAEKNADDETIINAAKETFDSFTECFKAPVEKGKNADV
ncbi:MAG TPA: biliverdin-producing heme oxygenase [Pyrinomonadaceae bacterium]|nr:biliverdin-producing heme oxygenase [Pyrinomonadaceae bacterium]